MTKIALTVNSTRHEADVEPRLLLAYFLRNELGLTGTSIGCDTSSCGTCTVLVDGESIKSCDQVVVQLHQYLASSHEPYGNTYGCKVTSSIPRLRSAVQRTRDAQGGVVAR